MTTLIHPGERLDELHPYGLFILQHPDAFRFGTDAVLLAHFARAKKQGVVIHNCAELLNISYTDSEL